MIAALHVHSTHSDGRDTVKKLLERAIELRIDVISITDHDTVNGSLEAMEIAEEEFLSIKILPGVELTTDKGHLLIYGVMKDFDKGMPFEEAVNLARKLGGVSFIAHPFQIERKGIASLNAIKKADGVEAFNSKYVVGIFNYISLKLAEKFKKPVIAGSDAHSAKALGYGLTILKSDPLNALKSGMTEISGRRMPLRVWLSDSLGFFDE